MKTIKLKQGTILPTTGIGVFYILPVAVFAAWWVIGSEVFKEPIYYLFLIVFSVAQFTTKSIVVSNSIGYLVVYRYFGIRVHSRFFHFKNYNFFVFKVVKSAYNVSQSGTGGMLSSVFSEEKTAILGRDKYNKKMILICKGSKTQILDVVDLLLKLNYIVFRGAQKKGYEMKR